MTSRDDVLRLAMSLPEAEEVSHFGAVSVRVGKSIFAVLREADRVTIRLDPEDQHNLVAGRPGLVSPVAGGKRNERAGREGWTYVRYEACDEAELGALLRMAWATVAPKRLLR